MPVKAFLQFVAVLVFAVMSVASPAMACASMPETAADMAAMPCHEEATGQAMAHKPGKVFHAKACLACGCPLAASPALAELHPTSSGPERFAVAMPAPAAPMPYLYDLTNEGLKRPPRA